MSRSWTATVDSSGAREVLASYGAASREHVDAAPGQPSARVRDDDNVQGLARRVRAVSSSMDADGRRLPELERTPELETQIRDACDRITGAVPPDLAETACYMVQMFGDGDDVRLVTDSMRRACASGEVKWQPADAGRLAVAQDVPAIMAGFDGGEAGAWIAINPYDGERTTDEHVSSFKHALIECDATASERQVEANAAMCLSDECLVWSGSKSVHAIVDVDAKNADEYAHRVGLLYSACEMCGLEIDRANKSPGHLLRLPVMPQSRS